MEKELRKYYRSISKCLPVAPKLRRQILERIRQSVKDYLSENPETDMNKILEIFGKPQEIAASYVENMTTPEILQRFHIRKTVLTVVCAAAAIALLLWATVVGIALVTHLRAGEGYIVVEPVVEVTEGAGEAQ